VGTARPAEGGRGRRWTQSGRDGFGTHTLHAHVHTHSTLTHTCTHTHTTAMARPWPVAAAGTQQEQQLALQGAAVAGAREAAAGRACVGMARHARRGQEQQQYAGTRANVELRRPWRTELTGWSLRARIEPEKRGKRRRGSPRCRR
jgi:hypothetical protein